MLNRLSKSRKNLTTVPRATKVANDLLLKHYNMLSKCKKLDKPVAWVGVDVPGYIFWAMGIVPVFPQMHAAYQAQRKAVKKMMDKLESEWEIPHNICGEIKGVMGSVLCDHELAFKIPKPDIIVTTNCACGQVVKGFKYVSEYLGVDMLTVDFPFVYEDITKSAFDYGCKQFSEIVEYLETNIGRRMDIDELKNISYVSYIFSQMWKEICEANINIPAPIDALDLYLFTSLFLVLESDKKILDIMMILYNEIFGQVQRNKQIESEENYRVLWHFLPIYSKKNFFKELFDKHGVTVVTGTYLQTHEYMGQHVDYQFSYPVNESQIQEMKGKLEAIISDLSEERIRDFIIKDNVSVLLGSEANRGVQYKYEQIKKLVKNYKIDGLILHNDRSCRSQSLPQYELHRIIQDELNIPVLYFDSDTIDERYFSESQITTRFEAFIEQMDTNKKRRIGE